MSLSINKNILSLKAQRHLAESTDRLRVSSERLASGMRINKASDDAAGLAISASLNANVKIAGQAYRNANDGISVLNIASGALEAFSTVLTRQKELAEQAANQTYSQAQRLALQNESDALTQEFNRIAATTTFNDKALFNINSGRLSIQLGTGLENYLSLSVGDQLNRNVFNDSFDTATNQGAFGGTSTRESFGDVNGDGNSDVVFFNGTTLVSMLSNGDGTFQAENPSAAGISTLNRLQIVDLNNDGKNDIVGLAGTKVQTFLGRGDGTFSSGVSFSTLNTNSFNSISTGDFNGDGKADVAVNFAGGKATTETINVLYGNGDGTLQSGARFAAENYFIGGFQVADFNNDGYSDVIGLGSTPNFGIVYLGSKTGLSSTGLVSSIATTNSISIADFNRDGFADIVRGASGSFYAGKGDGTFMAATSIESLSGTTNVADLNGDGYSDIYTFSGTEMKWLYGNGDGTFKASQSMTLSFTPGSDSTLKDFNNDGVLDIAGTEAGSVNIALAQTKKSASVQYFNIATVSNARTSLDLVETSMKRVRGEIGIIGASQSRLFSALNTLESSKTESQAAYNRIVDTDIAQELSELNRLSILQKTATAVMAQANIQPELALKLLI